MISVLWLLTLWPVFGMGAWLALVDFRALDYKADFLMLPCLMILGPLFILSRVR